ncbi:hypothetical protein H6P81_002617 [Aristolochia fimbriata]|uniref:Pentatricopeptide repeat-containing protein n=1 Tax=Aristolochia fimbriata TaxID=158543 RepID=A0AAV7FC16_ARIFI|nr:hypothetical protein H6P81_002617 [Aristolochia fimbriata]
MIPPSSSSQEGDLFSNLARNSTCLLSSAFRHLTLPPNPVSRPLKPIISATFLENLRTFQAVAILAVNKFVHTLQFLASENPVSCRLRSFSEINCRNSSGPRSLRLHNFAAILPGDSVAGLVVSNGIQNFLNIYNTLLVVRLVLTWFPNSPPAIVSPLSTICDPYLNIFRGLIPPLGGTLDLSPILAFLVLNAFTSAAAALPAELPSSGASHALHPSHSNLQNLTTVQQKWFRRIHRKGSKTEDTSSKDGIALSCRSLTPHMLFARVETLRFFQTYLHSSNISRYNYFLNSCSSLEHLKQIHAQILRNGLHQNILLSTKLTSACCNLSSASMDYAHSIFGTIPHPDAFAYNTLIRGYAVAGPCHKALQLYRKMHLSGLHPDNFTFPFVVRSCAVLSLLSQGKQVHCVTVKCGLDSDVFVQSALLTMYAQTGETFCAELVFEEITSQNVVSWTAMIAGYVQNGFLKESLAVFRQMVVSGTKPNSVTLVSILPACAGLEILSFGELIHGYAVKVGVDSDVNLVNSLIALYGKCKKVGLARFLFDRMKIRNLVSWNAVIAAYEQNEAGEEAIKLFQRLRTENVKFDYITLVSVISACASLGALRTGRWVHEIVQSQGLESNFSVANALLDMYAKCGCIDSAKTMFDKLSKRNVVSWSAMIGAYAAHGHGGGALKLFYKMLEDGIKPNSYTFTSVLTACRHSGLIEEGVKHFNSMRKDYSIEPGEEHFSCLVDLLGRAGRLIEAYKFIKQMPVEPGVGVWGAFLAACRTYGNAELAEVVVKHLIQLDPQNVTYYVLMANLYAEVGRWDDVLKLRKIMKVQKLKKVPGHSLLVNVVV